MSSVAILPFSSTMSLRRLRPTEDYSRGVRKNS
jgi:hypothetical protein